MEQKGLAEVVGVKGRATRASCKTREFVAVASHRTRAEQILSGIMW